MDPIEKEVEDTGLGRVSTRSGPARSVRPRVENPERLLRSITDTGQKSSASDKAPLTGADRTENRSHWVYKSLLPRLEAWLEETLIKEMPHIVQDTIDRTVPTIVDIRLQGTVTPLVDDLVCSVMEQEFWAATSLGDPVTPLGRSFKAAIDNAVEARLANPAPIGTVVVEPQPPTAARAIIYLSPTGMERTSTKQVHMVPQAE